MTKYKEEIFPSWVVRNKCIRVRNAIAESKIERISSVRRNKIYRWSMARSRSASKLRYRYNKYLKERRDRIEWNIYLSHQLYKLNKKYSSLYLWNDCEFANCEKVNGKDFKPEKWKSSLWKFVAVENSKDFVQRLNSNRLFTPIRKGEKWDEVIIVTKNRFKRNPKKEKSEDTLQVCYRCNKEKLKNFNVLFTWRYCIQQNKEKVTTLIKNYSKLINKENSDV